MSNRRSNPGHESAAQAANVLRAWALSDESSFRKELGRTLDLSAAQGGSLEEEKIELLQTVAVSLGSRMPRTGDDCLVHLCFDLLVHLAAQPCADPAVSAGGCIA